MTDLTVVPVTPEMTILDRSHGEFIWDNSGSISGGLCILRWGFVVGKTPTCTTIPSRHMAVWKCQRAIDQDFLLKNPARKLEMPVTRKSCKRYLSSEEVQKLLAALDAAIA